MYFSDEVQLSMLLLFSLFDLIRSFEENVAESLYFILVLFEFEGWRMFVFPVFVAHDIFFCTGILIYLDVKYGSICQGNINL